MIGFWRVSNSGINKNMEVFIFPLEFDSRPWDYKCLLKSLYLFYILLLGVGVMYQKSCDSFPVKKITKKNKWVFDSISFGV